MANAIIRGLAPDLELIIGTNLIGETVENKTNGTLTLVNTVNTAGLTYDYMDVNTVLATLKPTEIYTLVANEAVYIQNQRAGATSTVPTFRISAT